MGRSRHYERNKRKGLSIQEKDEDNGEVEKYLRERHRALRASTGLESSDDGEAETSLHGTSVGVMNLSSSEEDSEEDSEDQEKEEEEGWGGKKRDYYGGDAEDYEVMDAEEREEVLGAEEEEALKKQKGLLKGMREGDYRDIDGDDDEDESDESDGDSAAEREVERIKKEKETYAGGLLLEVQRVWKEIENLRAMCVNEEVRLGMKIRLDVLFCYCQCLLYYIALAADPKYTIDHEWHPVVQELVRLRQLEGRTRNYAKHKENVAAVEVKLNKSRRRDVLRSQDQEGTEKGKSIREKEEKAMHREKNEESTIRATSPDVITKSGGAKNKEGSATPSKRDSANLNEDDFMTRVMGKRLRRSDNANDGEREKKSRKLGQITSNLERELQSRRRAGAADIDYVRRLQSRNSLTKVRENGWEGRPPQKREVLSEEEKAARQRRRTEKMLEKAGKGRGHVYTYDDRIEDDERRRATKQVLMNRGLVASRPKAKRNPRMKHKGSFTKAKKRRRGAVRDIITNYNVLHYAGEATGINPRAQRSTLL